MTERKLSIAFVPRERFSVAPSCLRTLLERTPHPFQLIVVDPGMPEPWRTEVLDLASGHPDLAIVPPADGPVLPNAARNLALEQASGDWVCFVENDVVVGEGWLPPLLDAAEEFDAGAAVPLILERLGEFEKVHFDDRLHRIVETVGPHGIERRIEPRPDSKERDRGAGRRQVDFIETHCMLFRRRALERVGGFDGSITAQEEIDISFSLHASGELAVLEPTSTVTFLPPPPIYPSEREYYLSKWNPATYVDDHRTMSERWGIVGYPGAVGVVESRRAMAAGDPDTQLRKEVEFRERLRATAEDLAMVTSRGGLVLAHDGQLDLSLVCPEADVLPFLERGGVWFGPPADSQTAIDELARMRADGAASFAVAWPAFWWLEYYDDFESHLRTNFDVIAETDQLIAFDLTESPPSEEPTR